VQEYSQNIKCKFSKSGTKRLMFKQQLWLSIKSLFEYTKKLTQGLKSKIKSRNNVWNKASEGIYCDLIGPKMLSKS